MAVSGTLAAIAIAGTIYSTQQQAAAAKKQQEANKKAARAEAVKGQIERTNALRQNRISAAEIFAQASGAGLQNSSSVQGALGSQGTRAATDFSNTYSLDRNEQQRLRLLSGAQSNLNNAQIAEGISGLASSGVSAYGTYKSSPKKSGIGA